MISTEDQEALFRLIANYIEEDLECFAIGGTAMMFHGYKTATKDIDLVFKGVTSRQVFISAIEKLGYTQKSLKWIYSDKLIEAKGKPLLYAREGERFDLFVQDVFGFEIEFEEFVQRHDYIGKKELIIFTAPKELLILLKAITDREKDFEDIEAIARLEPTIDWNVVVDRAISKRESVPWILIDLEEKLQVLKKTTFIKKEIFDRIYQAEKKFSQKRADKS